MNDWLIRYHKLHTLSCCWFEWLTKGNYTLHVRKIRRIHISVINLVILLYCFGQCKMTCNKNKVRSVLEMIEVCLQIEEKWRKWCFYFFSFDLGNLDFLVIIVIMKGLLLKLFNKIGYCMSDPSAPHWNKSFKTFLDHVRFLKSASMTLSREMHFISEHN